MCPVSIRCDKNPVDAFWYPGNFALIQMCLEYLAQHSNYLSAMKLHNSMEQQASNTDANWNCKVKLPSSPTFSLRFGNVRDRDGTRSNVIKLDSLIMKWSLYRLRVTYMTDDEFP